MGTEADGINRRIAATVRDTLDVCRIQAAVGPVSEHVRAEILFRATHGVVQSLAPYRGQQQKIALLPSALVEGASVARSHEHF
jgi:hypothetical protein